jgi:hypothetical protein
MTDRTLGRRNAAPVQSTKLDLSSQLSPGPQGRASSILLVGVSGPCKGLVGFSRPRVRPAQLLAFSVTIPLSDRTNAETSSSA